jgi:hypothetical protein
VGERVDLHLEPDLAFPQPRCLNILCTLDLRWLDSQMSTR